MYRTIYEEVHTAEQHALLHTAANPSKKTTKAGPEYGSVVTTKYEDTPASSQSEGLQLLISQATVLLKQILSHRDYLHSQKKDIIEQTDELNSYKDSMLDKLISKQQEDLARSKCDIEHLLKTSYEPTLQALNAGIQAAQNPIHTESSREQTIKRAIDSISKQYNQQQFLDMLKTSEDILGSGVNLCKIISSLSSLNAEVVDLSKRIDAAYVVSQQYDTSAKPVIDTIECSEKTKSDMLIVVRKEASTYTNIFQKLQENIASIKTTVATKCLDLMQSAKNSGEIASNIQELMSNIGKDITKLYEELQENIDDSVYLSDTDWLTHILFSEVQGRIYNESYNLSGNNPTDPHDHL